MLKRYRQSVNDLCQSTELKNTLSINKVEENGTLIDSVEEIKLPIDSVEEKKH